MSVILLLCRILLALIFGIAGIAKLVDPIGSRKSMLDFGVPAPIAGWLGRLLALLEVICAVALIPVDSAWGAALSLLFLLTGFIVVLGISLMLGRRPDCHCFGQIHSSPIGWHTIFRNAILAGICAMIVSLGRENPGMSILGGTIGMNRIESEIAGLAIALAVLAMFQLWGLLHLLRQNGRLLLRLDAVEEKLTAGIAAPHSGLPVNSPAPGFNLTDLNGASMSLDSLLESGKPLFLMFSEPSCGACDAILPDLAQWQQEYRDLLSIVLISRGNVGENRSKSDKYQLQNVLLQKDREVAREYRVEGTPSAVLIRKGRIESWLAVGPDAIRELIARAILPAPISQGDRVPTLRLPDLGGKMIDLAQLRNPRTLLLFWSPSCGFCQEMLDELKSWERNPPDNAPELVVISTGVLEENRKQGFRSCLLLDPRNAASHVFKSGGTPSAVLIERGIVASDVAVGAHAVLTLAAGTSAVSN